MPRLTEQEQQEIMGVFAYPPDKVYFRKFGTQNYLIG